jgi:acid phosphatase family membrane protein YuiD
MSKYELLLAPIAGWAIAQGIKFGLTLRKDGLQLSDLYTSGGFPSSHTASIVPVVVLLGLRRGLDDPLFALAAIMTALVMYDAVGVRRSSGENSTAIKELAQKSGKTLTTRMHGAKGHTPYEVMGGIIVGVAVAYLFFLFI